MENKNNTTLENLSSTEIEMIRIQREKDAIAKQERELRQKLTTEKEIKEMEVRIANFEAKWQRQNTATRNYLAQLQEVDSRFFIKENKRIETGFIVYHYGDKEEKYSEANRIYDFKKEIEYVEMEIHHSEVGKIIEVKEHITSDGSYRARSTNHGYKMYMKYGDNRCTKDPKHMAKKFTEILEQKAAEVRNKNAAQTSQQMAEAKLKEMYADAIVEHKSEMIYPSNNHGGYRRHDQKPYETTWFNVVFPNGYGIKVGYGVNNNELWLRKDGTIAPNFEGESNLLLDPKNKGVQNFIAALQNISK